MLVLTGTLVTRPVGSREYLFVNAEMTGGALCAEVLDQNDQVIAPFTAANCVPVTASGTARQITWAGAPDLSALSGQPVKFRFTMREGKLYAFWVSPDISGASYGYLTAGGPGFPGGIDTVGGSASSNNELPSVSLTAPTGTGSYIPPATVALAANASDGDGAVTLVQFYANGTLVGSDNAPPYNADWADVATGTYTLTARAFDNVGGHGVSAPVTITVGFPNNLKPVVDLTSPASGSVFDLADPVTLLADASDPDGTVGRVDFYVDSQLVGTDDSSPYAAIWTTALSGSHNLTAVAVDDLGAATTSAPIIVSVVAGGVSVNVALAANGATATASSTYHSGYPAGAAIDGRRSGAIRGQLGTWEDSTDAVPDWLQIDFAAPYAIDEVHVFSMQENWMAPLEPTPVLTSYLAAEDFEVQYWNGAAWVVVPGGQVVGSTRVWARVHFAPVTTSAVRIVVTKVAGGRTRLSEVEVYREGFANTLPSVELLSPAGGSSFTAPVTIQLQASASDPDGSVTQVAFHADGQLIGTDTTSPYETTWPDVTAGTYAITVIATDDSGNTRTSLPATVSVTNQPNVPPMVSLTAPGSGSVFAVADAVALRATASDPNGTVARVDFFAGALPIGSDPTSPYEVTWTAGPVGPYSLTAVAVDNLNLATTSTAVPVSVVAAGARVNVALAAHGATATASSTYTTDYAARAAIDGRRSGAIRGQLGTWEDAGALLPDWFQVTFAAPSSIDQVNIFSMQVAWWAPVEPTPTLTSGLAAENFDIQYWNGADWVVVPGGQVVGNTLVWKQVSFAPITTSALRIAVTKVAGGITRLTEVEAWTAASGVSPPVATLTASPSTIAAGGAATCRGRHPAPRVWRSTRASARSCRPGRRASRRPPPRPTP